MSTKITYIGSKPSTTTGTDVTGYGPHSPATIDQNFANLQAAVDTVTTSLNGHSFANNEIAKSTTSQYLRIWGGDVSHGAYLLLFGDTHATSANKASLVASGGLAITSPQLTLDASGNLLVGSISNTRHAFVKNNNANYAGEVSNTASAANSPYGFLVSYPNVTNGAGNAFIHCIDNLVRFAVAGNGNVQNANNSYGAISDLKLKENVETARNYLTDLCAVRVVKYSLIADAASTATHLGVIAQEIEQVFPGMVEETPDMGQRQAIVDGVPQVGDDGAPIMERYDLGTTTKSVKYSVFVPMLITAVQELKSENNELRTENTELKVLVENLAVRVAALEAQ